MDFGPNADNPGKLEQLAQKLYRRELHVKLAPDSNNELMLEVIYSRLDSAGAAVRAGHVYWRDGAFWWSRLAEPERLPDITRAAERISAALQRSHQYLALVPAPRTPDNS